MTPSRKPNGCVFWPMSALLVADDDRDVSHALGDRRRASLSAGTPAAHVLVRCHVGERGLDDEGVEVDVLVLLTGVRDRAVDDLRDDRSGGLPREAELVERG